VCQIPKIVSRAGANYFENINKNGKKNICSSKKIMHSIAKKANVAAELVNTVSTIELVKDVKGSNGTAPVEEAVAEVIKEEVKEVVKIPAPEPVPAPVPVLTMEQKLERVEELNKIIAKYQRLQEARKKLNTFKIGSEGLTLT
jgi:hypothetical protein